MRPLNVREYERLAAGLLDPGAYGYFAGGANDERTLAGNVEAFRRLTLRPRVLVDVSDPSTAAAVLGEEVLMPLLVAPMAYQRLAHPDGEVAMARAAAAAGTIMCVSTLSTCAFEEVVGTGARCWFQLYVPRDEALARELVAGAEELGFAALVVTVDVPVSGRRERDLRTGFSLPAGMTVPSVGRGGIPPHEFVSLLSPSVTWEDVAELAALSRLPLVLKGVLTGEDALLAVEHGAAAIVVSNHGGRQLDGVAAPIDVLSEVVEAVEGRVEVLVDGGVRRGTDVVKALALGAKAVLVGRPLLWGLAVAGEAGARDVLELLREELELALQLTGCRTPAEVTAAHVNRPRSTR